MHFQRPQIYVNTAEQMNILLVMKSKMEVVRESFPAAVFVVGPLVE
jgi:hypothetical protein